MSDVSQLSGLANPNNFQGPIDIGQEEPESLIGFLRQMLLIRVVERKLAEGREKGLIGGPMHLGVGQEAAAVGVSRSLRPTDRVFGAHRSHSHLLALGGDVRKLCAEVLGRSTGHSKGMGGSMHLWDQSVGFFGSVPIVAGTVPLAVGAAMAARLSGQSDVSIAYLGDGALEEGVVHESLNLAAINQEPIIFVVENNLFASHMHISQRQPSDSTARFAKANNINHEVLDGNDVVRVAKHAAKLIADAREGRGPGFLELVTYRWYGHVDWREDVDVGVNRSQDDVYAWRARDPIKRLATSLISRNICSQDSLERIEEEIQAEVNEQWALALSDPYPEDSALLSYVYAESNA